MRIMVDANILISALLYPESTPAKALRDISAWHKLLLADYIIKELWDVTKRKFPSKQADLDVLLSKLSFEFVAAPREPSKLISDPKDAPILNAAILAEADVIVSGDRHFLQLEMDHPRVMTVADYMRLSESIA